MATVWRPWNTAHVHTATTSSYQDLFLKGKVSLSIILSISIDGDAHCLGKCEAFLELTRVYFIRTHGPRFIIRGLYLVLDCAVGSIGVPAEPSIRLNNASQYILVRMRGMPMLPLVPPPPPAPHRYYQNIAVLSNAYWAIYRLPQHPTVSRNQITLNFLHEVLTEKVDA